MGLSQNGASSRLVSGMNNGYDPLVKGAPLTTIYGLPRISAMMKNVDGAFCGMVVTKLEVAHSLNATTLPDE